MNAEQTQVMQTCARGALTGELTFPEIVGSPAQIGVERYHADYSRQEITYYLSDGGSLVVGTPHPSLVSATEFSASAVEAAVRLSLYCRTLRRASSLNRTTAYAITDVDLAEPPYPPSSKVLDLLVATQKVARRVSHWRAEICCVWHRLRR
jgi:hypothetical protein